MIYAKSLKFEQQPDYEYIKNLLKDAAGRFNMAWDYIFDWMDTGDDEEPITVP